MDNLLLTYQYNLIHHYFKTTIEPYDKLDWNGEVLEVISLEEVIETYTLSDLNQLIPNFEKIVNQDNA